MGSREGALKIIGFSPLLVGKLINLVPFPGAAYRRIRGVEDSRVPVLKYFVFQDFHLTP
jgi:hypothetical protein